MVHLMQVRFLFLRALMTVVGLTCHTRIRSCPSRCPFRKSLVSIFAGQREEWEGMLT
jgi:hypothetical protein